MASKREKGSGSESPQNGQPESEIRETAYMLYMERRAQNAEGDEQSDWRAAEELVRAKYGSEKQK
jgi:hypothetical protein